MASVYAKEPGLGAEAGQGRWEATSSEGAGGEGVPEHSELSDGLSRPFLSCFVPAHRKWVFSSGSLSPLDKRQ